VEDSAVPDRAVIYARVSTLKQSKEDRYSLAEQRDLCRAYCEIAGYQVVEVVSEVGSGMFLHERPELARVRAMLYRGEVGVLVVYAWDRVARDPDYQSTVRGEAKAAGARVESVSEPNDDSPQGALFRSLLGHFGAIEWAKIRDRTMGGKRQRAAQGKMLPASVPLYGYRWADPEKSRYEAHPKTAPVVVHIFEMIAHGMSIARVCVRLSEEDIPGPRAQLQIDRGEVPTGGPWKRSTVFSLLHNPAYWGEYAAFRYFTQGKRRDVDPVSGDVSLHRIQRIRNEDEGVIPMHDAAPALISLELAEAVRLRLAANKAESLRNNRSVAMLRAGYVLCGHCGRKLHVRPGRPATRTRAAYFCPSRYSSGHYVSRDVGRCPTPWVPVEDLDREVWGIIKGRVSNPEWIAAEVKKRAEDDGQTEHTLSVLAEQIAEYERQQGNLAKSMALTDDEGIRATLMGEMAQVTERAKRKTEERDQLKVLLSDRTAMMRSVERFAVWCEEMTPALDEATLEQRRFMLYALDVKVRAYEGGAWEYEDRLGAVSGNGIVSEASRSRARRAALPSRPTSCSWRR
jgi:DNA invertase Pin-like site-specific DNA recombinase